MLVILMAEKKNKTMKKRPCACAEYCACAEAERVSFCGYIAFAMCIVQERSTHVLKVNIIISCMRWYNNAAMCMRLYIIEAFEDKVFLRPSFSSSGIMRHSKTF